MFSSPSRRAMWSMLSMKPSLLTATPLTAVNLTAARLASTKAIKVVLLHDVKEFGKKGDVLSVKRGTARLQLIPYGLANYATDLNIQKHARIGEEIPSHVMSSLNQYRKGINALNTHHFNFLRFLQPGETADIPLDDTIHIEKEVKDSSKRKKKEKKVKKALIEDPETDVITTGVITDFLKEKLRLSLPEEFVLLEKPITEIGEYVVPLKINHLLISGLEERYLDPDIIQHTDYELKISFTKGVRAKPVKEKKEDATAAPADEGESTPAAAKEEPKKKAAKKEAK